MSHSPMKDVTMKDARDTKSGANSPITDGARTPTLQLPSPIITRRTRTMSTSQKALGNPEVKGKVRYFCREKGHGFIIPDDGSPDVFVHISDIEGEYIPLSGDEVTYRLCPVPPKMEKVQAVHVNIINLTPEVHLRWTSPPSPHADCSPKEKKNRYSSVYESGVVDHLS